MTYIELIGPSGAGKTTLRRNIQNHFSHVIAGQSGIEKCLTRVFEIPPYKWLPKTVQNYCWKHLLIDRYSEKFLIEYPHSRQLFDSIIEKSPGVNTKYHLKREMARNHLFRHQHKPNELAVIDDGLYQFSIILKEGMSSDLRLGSYLPSPDILVYFEIDSETCLKRQEQRDRGRASAFEELNYHESILRLDSMKAAAQEIATDFKNRGVTVIRITAESRYSDAYEKILEYNHNNTP